MLHVCQKLKRKEKKEQKNTFLTLNEMELNFYLKKSQKNAWMLEAKIIMKKNTEIRVKSKSRK